MSEICESTNERTTSSDPLAGTGYRTIKAIGEGATAVVLEATTRRGVRVAVKVVRSQYAGSREVVVRFEREGRALAAVRHARLVRVLDAGRTCDGRPFLVMPKLHGETLRDRLACGALPTDVAIDLACDVLEGLDAAHAAGLIHRDVKPANVFVLETGRAMLLDFGLAKLLDDPTNLTANSHILGTPRYVAPEQILGGVVGPATDVYATALVLYEMLAARPVFAGTDAMAVMDAHITEEPRPLGELLAIAPSIEEVIMRALQKSPAKRWKSAHAFAWALRAAVLEAGSRGASWK